MPNQPKTPARSVRIDDDLWAAAQEEARREDVPVSDVVRAALRKHLGLAAIAMLLLSGCGAASAEPAAKPARPVSASEWSGTHGLTTADAQQAVASTAKSSTPDAKPYGSWDCDEPMVFHPEAGPGVDVAAVYRELEYPVAYLNALGYRASVGAQVPYELNADRPAERGSITVVVTNNRADQYDLTTEPKVRAFAQFAQEPHNASAALVVFAPTGLAGDIILHEAGHVLGLDHKAGTVMNGVGAGTLAFDADETAAISCN